ncbi:MAG: App1 family protein [Chitinophagaceae bacterium]
MQTTKSTATIKKSEPISLKWKQNLMRRFRLTNTLTVKLYNGYGYAQKLIIFGHVLSLAPVERKRFSNFFLINLFSLLRLFIVKPVSGAMVQLRWEGDIYKTTTNTDGYFTLEWESKRKLEFGWREIEVELVTVNDKIITTGAGSIFIPHVTQYGFISDIDDTFLISHSSNLRKRLFVLFTNNARSRKPFEGVVKHYQLLAKAQTNEDEPNPFFYVSSSEWNLYDYLVEFTAVNALPRGVFLLSQLKLFSEIIKTGQNKHATKFARIVRLLETFPTQKFILLGDSSQHDAEIYTSIAEHFPGRIRAVYIRDVRKKNKQNVLHLLQKLEEAGISCCLFEHSEEAINHSKNIGLIQ